MAEKDLAVKAQNTATMDVETDEPVAPTPPNAEAVATDEPAASTPTHDDNITDGGCAQEEDEDTELRGWVRPFIGEGPSSHGRHDSAPLREEEKEMN